MSLRGLIEDVRVMIDEVFGLEGIFDALKLKNVKKLRSESKSYSKKHTNESGLDLERGNSMQSNSLSQSMIAESPRSNIYTKKMEQINDNFVYTISKTHEKPPKIDDLINLKVRVPKIRISKYLENQHSPEREEKVGLYTISITKDFLLFTKTVILYIN